MGELSFDRNKLVLAGLLIIVVYIGFFAGDYLTTLTISVLDKKDFCKKHNGTAIFNDNVDDYCYILTPEGNYSKKEIRIVNGEVVFTH